MIHADYLFLLTDVDGLYTSNPRKDPNARLIEEVTSISTIREQGQYKILLYAKYVLKLLPVSTKTLGSSLGTGGMETKIIAAEIATGAGVTTVITSSKRPQTVFDIIQYHNLRRRSDSSTPGTPREPRSGRGSPEPAPALVLTSRPPHTLFTPSVTPMRDLKSWTTHTLYPSGSVIVDYGAHQVLSRRESGGRLLAAGVVGVLGAFASGQAVRICIMKAGIAAQDSFNAAYAEDNVTEVGRGLANYNSDDIAKVKGMNR